MKDKITSFERRLEMLFYILHKKQTNVPTLANYFSISRCTAYRDVIFLSRYVPIYTKNGKHGGVFLCMEHRHDFRLHLSTDEEKLLYRLVDKLNDNEARLLKNILHKYSMPKFSA